VNETDVRLKARRFVAETVSNGMPDLARYASKIGAKIRFESLPENESGFTLPKGAGYVITVNNDDSDDRRNFTVCHEIAHVELRLASDHADVPGHAPVKRHLNEVWCDIFAAELLMPVAAFRARVPEGTPTPEILEVLGRQFGASFQATASRYASLVSFPCAYVHMSDGSVRYTELNAALRSKGLRCPIKCDIPSGSVASRIRAAGISSIETHEVAQDLWFENCERGAQIWEMSRHYGAWDATVSLLWCEEDELPQGEVDRFGRRVKDAGGLEELSGEITWESHGPKVRR